MKRRCVRSQMGTWIALSQSSTLSYDCYTTQPFYCSQEETLADVCSKKYISIYPACTHVGKCTSVYSCSHSHSLPQTHTTSSRLAGTDVCMSPMSPITSLRSLQPYGSESSGVRFFLLFFLLLFVFLCLSIHLCLSCTFMALWSFSSHPASLSCTQGPIIPLNTLQSAQNA